MHDADTATSRNQVLRRLRSGEKAAAIAAESGISGSTVYRWKREPSFSSRRSRELGSRSHQTACGFGTAADRGRVRNVQRVLLLGRRDGV
ncbi:MAG: helix-turn-helix domain-containing protein [Mycobacterium sp.]|uniref:helix-turn-helix domain-containing protein n=1 Tax=Mycobacterium sp. TaxID=1785 RepID=UPI003F9737E1